MGGHVLPQGHRATKMSRPTTSPGRVGGREQPTSEGARQPGTLKGQPVSGQTRGGLSPASLPALPSHCTTCRSESLFHVLASSGQPSQDSPHATTWTLLPQMRVLSRACTPLYKVLSCTSMQAAGHLPASTQWSQVQPPWSPHNDKGKWQRSAVQQELKKEGLQDSLQVRCHVQGMNVHPAQTREGRLPQQGDSTMGG